MTETKRLVTVTAATKANLGFLSSSDLRLLVENDTEILRHLSRITQNRLQTATSIIGDLMLRDTEKRLIATLIRLSGMNNPIYEKDVHEIFFSQEEVARMANVARTTASTILKKLERQNAIKITYRKLEVVDALLLKKYSLVLKTKLLKRRPIKLTQ